MHKNYINEESTMNHTCCIFGHREINETYELKTRITKTVEKLINEENVDTFLFGSQSSFDSLCLEILTALRNKYPHVKRVYVRAEFPFITDNYTAYLLTLYDDTYYPEKLLGAGRASYVKRNREMIDRSRFCVVYYDEQYSPKTRKSGTRLAYDYAVKKNREIINTAEDLE